MGINQHITSLACMLLSNVFLFLYSDKSQAREDCHRLVRNLFNDVLSTTEDMWGAQVNDMHVKQSHSTAHHQ